MPGSSSYLDSLAQVPLFVACSKKELQKIGKAVDEISVDEGRELITQGKRGREAFVIVRGEAAVKRNGRKIATLGPGEHFGELALLDGGDRTASVTANTPMTLLVLGQREFTGLIDEVPGLALKIMASLAGTIRELDTKIY
jgi:CRP-like cAMP-binding protein